MIILLIIILIYLLSVIDMWILFHSAYSENGIHSNDNINDDKLSIICFVFLPVVNTTFVLSFMIGCMYDNFKLLKFLDLNKLFNIKKNKLIMSDTKIKLLKMNDRFLFNEYNYMVVKKYKDDDHPLMAINETTKNIELFHNEELDVTKIIKK